MYSLRQNTFVLLIYIGEIMCVSKTIRIVARDHMILIMVRLFFDPVSGPSFDMEC